MRDAIIKSYHVWGALSRGGMGEVWLARHVDLAVPVVIKTLLPGTSESFEARYRRLLQEARLAARLTSPRVVRVVDVGVFHPENTLLESLPYLVEEYVDGIDLAELDRSRRDALSRPLPLWMVTGVIAQAAEGLHAAHQGGVVHCDVKPSNLFGHGHARVKVGDFGVAVAASLAETGAAAGTPGFMAPEQMLGARVDRRADVYSLGATAFTLRYGMLPFTGMLEALRPDAAARFPQARSPEEAYFQHVVARMMARNGDARFESMTAPWAHLRELSRATRPRMRTVRLSANVYAMGATRVVFEVGDLAAVETDAIVNSANGDLTMQTSLAAALRKAGGDEIEAEAVAGGARALGECVLTGAGKLKAKAVLHAVGGWKEVSCVARATHRALMLSESRKLERVAFPAIATGQGGVAMEACADAMVSTLKIHLALGGSAIREVRFVLASDDALRRFVDVAAGIIGAADEAPRLDDESDAPSVGEHAISGPTLFAASMHGAKASTPPPPIADSQPAAVIEGPTMTLEK